MSYMESAMQDQIDGSIALQNQVCDDACDVYKKTHLMASDLLKQRAELLEALKIAEKKIVDSYDAITKGHAKAFLSRDAQLSVIRNAIANAEK